LGQLEPAWTWFETEFGQLEPAWTWFGQPEGQVPLGLGAAGASAGALGAEAAGCLRSDWACKMGNAMACVEVPPHAQPGSLPRATIQAEIDRHRAEQNRCAKGYASRHPRAPDGIVGVVAFKFVIAADGAVRPAVISENTVGDPAFGSCLLAMVQTMRFPPTGGLIFIEYPFLLQVSGN